MSRPHPSWPVHGAERRPWRSSVRGSRADRTTTAITVSVPPRIADAVWQPDDGTAVLLARATAALRELEAADGTQPLARLLARTESVATSGIEHESATVEDVARALVGSRANASATAVVRADDALGGFVRSAADGRIEPTALLAAHRRLMRDDPVDGSSAGSYRTVQNWIGGGRTPRDADHVPPPPELVPELMDDLFAFLARDDLHPIAQAALAHAQFESIHPFTDGNGRVGRALVAAVLRRRGPTTTVCAPIATVLVADRPRYFAHLARYRDGHVDDWVRDLAIAVGSGCDEARVTGLVLTELRAGRRAAYGDALPHAVLARALDDDAVLTEERAEQLLHDAGWPTADGVLDRVVDDLCRTGTLRAVTTRRRDRAWVAPAVVAELDAFSERVRDGVVARARGVLVGAAA